MVTAAPAIDLYNPVFQQARDDFERKYFLNVGLEGLVKEVGREFHKHASIPYVCALIEDVQSGRWGLGRTQQEIADELGLERSCVSDALRKGRLGLETYLALRFHPMRPPNWEPGRRALDACNRGGFIGAAKLIARKSKAGQSFIQELDAFRHELICENFSDYLGWARAALTEDECFASKVVSSVWNNPRRDAVPGYFLNDVRSNVTMLAERLLADGKFAFKFLFELQGYWEDIYVATQAATETILWRS